MFPNPNLGTQNKQPEIVKEPVEKDGQIVVVVQLLNIHLPRLRSVQLLGAQKQVNHGKPRRTNRRGMLLANGPRNKTHINYVTAYQAATKKKNTIRILNSQHNMPTL